MTPRSRTSGITTVLDSLRVWRDEIAEDAGSYAEGFANAIDETRRNGLLRIEHFIHLRCEVPTPGVVEDTAALIGRPEVRLLSLMDHTPGQRQFRDPGSCATTTVARAVACQIAISILFSPAASRTMPNMPLTIMMDCSRLPNCTRRPWPATTTLPFNMSRTPFGPGCRGRVPDTLEAATRCITQASR